MKNSITNHENYICMTVRLCCILYFNLTWSRCLKTLCKDSTRRRQRPKPVSGPVDAIAVIIYLCNQGCLLPCQSEYCEYTCGYGLCWGTRLVTLLGFSQNRLWTCLPRFPARTDDPLTFGWMLSFKELRYRFSWATKETPCSSTNSAKTRALKSSRFACKLDSFTGDILLTIFVFRVLLVRSVGGTSSLSLTRWLVFPSSFTRAVLWGRQLPIQ